MTCIWAVFLEMIVCLFMAFPWLFSYFKVGSQAWQRLLQQLCEDKETHISEMPRIPEVRNDEFDKDQLDILNTWLSLEFIISLTRDNLHKYYRSLTGSPICQLDWSPFERAQNLQQTVAKKIYYHNIEIVISLYCMITINLLGGFVA